MNYYEYLMSVLHEAQGGQIQDPTAMMDPGVPPEQYYGDNVQGYQDPAMDPYGDAGYMDIPPEEMAPPPPEIDGIIEAERMKKLFENTNELLSLIEYLAESIGKINNDLIEEDQKKALKFIKDELRNLIRKINDFQLISFNSRTYEECLYTYMLFRSEFLTTVKFLRTTLKLDSLEINELGSTKTRKK